MLINSEGEQQELACFERDDDTEAHYSCSINWKNQFHVFGGSSKPRQISRLSGYRLVRIGTLDFDHRSGACSVMANHFIFLCFSRATRNQRRCWRSTGPLDNKWPFEKISMSNHGHASAKTSCSDSKSSCLISQLRKTVANFQS